MAKQKPQETKDIDFLDYLKSNGIDPNSLMGNLQNTDPAPTTAPSTDDSDGMAAAMNAIQPGDTPPQAQDPSKLSIKDLLAHALNHIDGKGMDDDVPATIQTPDGQPNQPAALSNGEYVIPASDVAMFGDGNSEAGAKVIEQLLKNLRMQKTGTTKQPAKLADLLQQPQ